MLREEDQRSHSAAEMRDRHNEEERENVIASDFSCKYMKKRASGHKMAETSYF